MRLDDDPFDRGALSFLAKAGAIGLVLFAVQVAIVVGVVLLALKIAGVIG